ncbi:MAG: hypothetical protein H7249_20175 [Chitinophagaceae bacterium]|nr:hypothetical protein [Oligoflexus sp.]
MSEQANNQDETQAELKMSVQEAAEKIKKFSEDLRHKIQTAQTGAQDKALDLLQSVETLSEKYNIKTDVEAKAFELLESVEHLSEKLQAYAEHFEEKLSDSQLQFHLGLMEAMGKWDEIKQHASAAVGSVHLDTVSSTLFDEVKLRASLGKMDTKEFIEKGREELSKAWQQVSHQSTLAVRNMNQSIGEIIHRFV